MTAASRRRVVFLTVLVAVIGAAALGTYLVNGRTATKDGGAKAPAKGPAAVPVTVVRVAQETVPVRLNAIGNVEAFSTVAVEGRRDGQIVHLDKRQGAAVQESGELFRT